MRLRERLTMTLGEGKQGRANQQFKESEREPRMHTALLCVWAVHQVHVVCCMITYVLMTCEKKREGKQTQQKQKQETGIENMNAVVRIHRTLGEQGMRGCNAHTMQILLRMCNDEY